jgi:hypothetical protein
MKPKIETKFPITDHNYQSVALDGCRGSCAHLAGPSFRSISRDYFKNEARQDFLGEALFFVAIVLTTAVPLASGAYVLAHFIAAIGAV